MLREAITNSPLYWPEGRPRTQIPERSNFGKTTVGVQTQVLLRELDLMGVPFSDVKISTNLRLNRDGTPKSQQPRALDPGVAVWFDFDGEETVIACDAWDVVEHNLRAIAKNIEALRGIERWKAGTTKQVFKGFAALPAEVGKDWRSVLGFKSGEVVDADAIRRRFKNLALDAHPDAGGDVATFQDLNRARDEGLRALGRKP